MRRSTLVVIVFVVLAALVVGVSQFLRAQPPLELTVAVSPLAERWVRPAVERLNATEPLVASTRRVRFSLTVVDDLAVWGDERRVNWTPENHPAVWIPAANQSVDYALNARFPFQVVSDSLAHTPLIWGGFASRVQLLTDDGAQPFDWAAVAAAAEAESWSALGGQPNWGFVKLAFDRPDQTMSGFAVLLTGAAAYGESADVTQTVTNSSDFRNWFAPVGQSVANSNTLGADAAAAMASRGASVAEIGLLPESRWLTNLDGLLRHEPIVLAYPQYPFVFDFPLARWAETQASAEESAAAQVLANWLLTEAQQQSALDAGLRPAVGAVPENARLFTEAVDYGALLDPDLSTPASGLARTEAQRLLQWFVR